MELTFLFESFSLLVFFNVLLKWLEAVGESLPSSTEKELGEFLEKQDPALFSDWVFRVFQGYIDKLFEDRFWSFRAWKRVWLVSLTSSFLIYLAAAGYGVDDWKRIIGQDWIYFMVNTFLIVLLTLPIDYLIFYKTKLIFQKIAGHYTLKKLWAILGIDFGITFLLAAIKILLLWILFYAVQAQTFRQTLSFIFTDVITLHYSDHSGHQMNLRQIPGVYFYTSFLSSALIWIFVLTAILATYQPITARARKHLLDLKDKPVKAIKTLFMTATLLIFIIANLIRYVVVFVLWQLWLYVS